MGILFKTYNGKHQLHLYQETWRFATKKYLDDVLSLFSAPEMKKIKMKNVGNFMELEFSGVIVECHDLKDLKHKFSLLADMKDKFQKITAQKK
ncbi:hypothetical protein HY496_00495 [Candidatus Woesearchaeota archaeon]|nr:hypothetical protein [Candidatus Woesearchaeota archaeon]